MKQQNWTTSCTQNESERARETLIWLESVTEKETGNAQPGACVDVLLRCCLKVTWLLCNHALLTNTDWAIQPKYFRTNLLRYQSSTPLNLCQRRVKWTVEDWSRDELTKWSYDTELVICSLANHWNTWLILELVVEIKYKELRK